MFSKMEPTTILHTTHADIIEMLNQLALCYDLLTIVLFVDALIN